MIWERLGRMWAEAAEAEEEEEDDYEDEKIRLDLMHSARARTIECLNKAISLAPADPAAYRALAKNYVRWEQDDAAADVLLRLLAQVPDDIDAIIFLFHYHRKRDEALAARDYALQARRLKPASAEMLDMAVAGHFLAARALALEGRGNEARAELAAVETTGLGPGLPVYDLAVRRAMVEFKAGQPAAGRQWMDQALKESDDPADVYMALSIEAVRYELPFELDGMPVQFWDRWLSSLKTRRSRAAGPMSQRIFALMRENQQLSGKNAFLNDYLERVIKYLSGCSRIRWQAGDLVKVCRFFDQVAVDTQFRERPQAIAEIPRSGPQEVSPGAGVPCHAGANGNAAGTHLLQSPPGARVL